MSDNWCYPHHEKKLIVPLVHKLGRCVVGVSSTKIRKNERDESEAFLYHCREGGDMPCFICKAIKDAYNRTVKRCYNTHTNTPAMVELSHPTSRFPSVAAIATFITSLIVKM